MIKNYITTALRYLSRNITFSIINTIGLSIGIAAFILLFLYVYNELTYDNFHKNKNTIYRLCENDMEFTRGIVLNKLLEDYPEIINGSRYLDWSTHIITFKDKELMQELHYVDTGFFSVFTFPFIYGNPENSLVEKNSVVISKKIATIYFGNENPVGKNLDVNFGKHSLLITGVIDEIPDNSSIKFDMVVSYETGLELDPWLEQVHDWYNTFSQTYIQLSPGVNPNEFEEKIQKVVEDYFLTGNDSKPRLKLLPLKELHNKTADNKSLTYILICIAIGVLLIASINFINLSTAGSIKRSTEVGLRKMYGAHKKSLIKQFLGESLIISFLGLFLSVVLTEILLPVFNKMFETRLVLDYKNIFLTFPVLIGLWLFTGVFSGIIPASIITRFKIIPSLKQEITSGKKAKVLRSSMVIFQLSLSIILIVGTMLMKKQILYMKHHNLNFDKENVIVVEPNSWKYKDKDAAVRKFEIIVNELEHDTRIKSYATSDIVPGRYIENYNNFYPEHWSQVESVKMRQGGVSKDYFKTYGIKFIEGNLYDEDYIIDSNAIVINKTALNKLEVSSAVGYNLHASSKTGFTHNIAGVVDDFYYMGLHRQIQPLLHYFFKDNDLKNAQYISIRIKPGEMTGVLNMLKEKWTSIEPVKELDYFFADDEIDKDYKQFEKINSLVSYFTLLAIIIACMGFIALTSFIGKQRTKEIGIRKSNGATTWQIMFLLSKEFTGWVMIAYIIACPIAWVILKKWLQSFAYRTTMSWWIFVLAGIIAYVIAMVTVSWQSWRAASRNPVEALRYE
ncbi:MAG: ABC transporter permease [Bacteroidales bacterium]|nr:ABC transporter permease [Bacteroidales bacterium]